MPLINEHSPLSDFTWSEIQGDRWQIMSVTSYNGGRFARNDIIATDKLKNLHNFYRYDRSMSGAANPFQHFRQTSATMQERDARFIPGPTNNSFVAWAPLGDSTPIYRYWYDWQSGQIEQRGGVQRLSRKTGETQLCRLGIGPIGVPRSPSYPYAVYSPSTGEMRWFYNWSDTHAWGDGGVTCTIDSGRVLVELSKKLLTWEPASGDYKLWDISLLSHNPLHTLRMRGFFETIFEPDQLVPIDHDRLLVWSPSANGARVRIYSLT